MLLVLRHGKSDWATDALDDFDRPLAPRGRKAVKRMAGWLAREDLLPERIISSTALRAEQTTKRLCRHGGVPESTVIWCEAIYEASVGTLLEVLARHGGAAGRVMIVGHNPGFEGLVEHLAGQVIVAPPSMPAFPTAAVARLDMPEDWGRLGRGSATLVSLTRPRELRD